MSLCRYCRNENWKETEMKRWKKNLRFSDERQENEMETVQRESAKEIKWHWFGCVKPKSNKKGIRFFEMREDFSVKYPWQYRFICFRLLWLLSIPCFRSAFLHQIRLTWESDLLLLLLLWNANDTSSTSAAAYLLIDQAVKWQ